MPFVVLDTFKFFQSFSYGSFSANKSIANGPFQLYAYKLTKQNIIKYNFFESIGDNSLSQMNIWLKNIPNFMHILSTKNPNFRKVNNFSIQKRTKISKNNIFSRSVYQNIKNSELYLDEIFWIPQEHYILSNIHFFLFIWLKMKNLLKI